ncbi:alpha/beta fold hydrolase [Nesterenkonia ebinurensis]|uniref:alpha/beta fold hydrolase n=1 Tax=Nesterenkonia ebinurensis TaxID=2608252 RepID=UPI00168BA7F8|nr:alpha/beta hydrolase [Nesterenkonia ebinurensis]
MGIAGTTAAVGGAAAAGYAGNNLTYARRDAARANRAGFRDKRITLRTGTTFAYSEGPDSGPSLLLLHAQGSARQSYDRVLPALAEHFHVYAVDIAGHGDSDRTPGCYTVHQVGADIALFIESVAEGPVILSGHSSGGLVAAWVAAEEPHLVSAVLFEDTPFFSTEGERYATQFNYIDLAVPAHDFLLQDVETDFAGWYIAHNAWLGYFGRGRDGIVRYARKRRTTRPDEPLRLWFLPPVTNESYAHMHAFDPAFADAFYERTWLEGFDQADALARITQPATVVHANWRLTGAGILEGAMTNDDATRANDLITNSTLERVHTGHGFHFEKPREYSRLLTDLATRARRP